jgi:hypothetical protein
VESPARKALENNSQSDFFWLLISTAFVAVGIALEYPEVKHEFIEWLRSRKKPWVVEPVPTSRNRVPLWSLIGFLVVTAGVAGEGVYEGLLGINDTKIRTLDESSLAADELQIAQLQKENLTLQKQAGDAAMFAHNAAADARNAKVDAGDAKTLARATRKEAAEGLDAASKRLDKAKQEIDDAGTKLLRLQPRASLLMRHECALVNAVKPFAGQKIELRLNPGSIRDSNDIDETGDFVSAISFLLRQVSQWSISEAQGYNGYGITLAVRRGSSSQTKNAADALASAFGTCGLTNMQGNKPDARVVDVGSVVDRENGPPDTIILWVGERPHR